MQNQYVTTFDTSGVYFNYSSLFSVAQIEKVRNPEKNVKTERAFG
jgi:hypothetical protein